MLKLFQNISILGLALIAQVNCNVGNNETQCFVPGECSESDFVGEKPVFSETECVKTCKENPSCFWWTFYPDVSACVLFTNCNKLVLMFELNNKHS